MQLSSAEVILVAVSAQTVIINPTDRAIKNWKNAQLKFEML